MAAVVVVIVVVVVVMRAECGDGGGGHVAVWKEAQTCHWIQEGDQCQLKTEILNAVVVPLVLHLEQGCDEVDGHGA